MISRNLPKIQNKFFLYHKVNNILEAPVKGYLHQNISNSRQENYISSIVFLTEYRVALLHKKNYSYLSLSCNLALIMCTKILV